MNDSFLPPVQGSAPEPEASVAAQPPTASFVWDVVGDQWWWSDEMYAIHGFEPGDVVPTSDLLAAHQHPEDTGKVGRALAEALEHGGRFSVYHRVVDSRRKVRHVLAVGSAARREDGTVTEVTGLMVDLTDSRRRELQPSIEEALQSALAHRSVIDQAKGALMLGLGIDADAAFAVLRSSSTTSNVKVKELARRLVDELASGEPDPSSRIDTLLAVVTDPSYEEQRRARG